jgi:hypothetical protein
MQGYPRYVKFFLKLVPSMGTQIIITLKNPIYSTPATAAYMLNNTRLLNLRNSEMTIRIVEFGADKNK